jgi:hypothetical protein
MAQCRVAIRGLGRLSRIFTGCFDHRMTPISLAAFPSGAGVAFSLCRFSARIIPIRAIIRAGRKPLVTPETVATRMLGGAVVNRKSGATCYSVVHQRTDSTRRTACHLRHFS